MSDSHGGNEAAEAATSSEESLSHSVDSVHGNAHHHGSDGVSMRMNNMTGRRIVTPPVLPNQASAAVLSDAAETFQQQQQQQPPPPTSRKSSQVQRQLLTATAPNRLSTVPSVGEDLLIDMNESKAFEVPSQKQTLDRNGNPRRTSLMSPKPASSSFLPGTLRRTSRNVSSNLQQVYEFTPQNTIKAAGTVLANGPLLDDADVEVTKMQSPPVYATQSPQIVVPSTDTPAVQKVIMTRSDQLTSGSGEDDEDSESAISSKDWFQCGLFGGCLPSSSQSSERGVITRLMQSQTLRIFLRVLIASVVILSPGLILEYAFPDVNTQLGGMSALVWFGTLAALIWLYPILRMLLHVLFYHVIPESAYDDLRHGNLLTYSSEIVSHLAATLSLIVCFIGWNLILPAINWNAGVEYNSIPFSYVNPVLGVLTLWIVGLAIKRVGSLWLVNQFNRSTYLDRVREDLFMDFIIETLKEAKRRIKFLRRVQEEEDAKRSEQGDAYHAVVQYRVPINPELLMRIKRLVIPRSFSELFAEEADLFNQEHPDEVITYHGWKRLLDHFYNVSLEDSMMREDIETAGELHEDEEVLAVVRQAMRRDLTVKRSKSVSHDDTEDKAKLSKSTDTLAGKEQYHHLHQYHHHRRQKRMKVKRMWQFSAFDEKATRLSEKMFRQLRTDQQAEFVDVSRDLMPMFTWDTSAYDDKNNTLTESERDLFKKQRNISRAIRLFLMAKSERGKFTQSDMQQMFIKAFRDRSRLIASLSGMKSVIRKVEDFLAMLLFFLLVIGTLTIFGVNTYSFFLSLSSIMVSLAFLFGSSAKSAFEGVILIFFVHPYDVGDRIIINAENYIVTKINLLSTVVEKWDGQLIYMSNSKIALNSLTNYRRSKPQCDVVTLQVSFSTPVSVLQELAKVMTEWVRENQADYQDTVSTAVESFVNLETLVVKVYYVHRSSWQNFDLFTSRRAKFYLALAIAMKKLDMSFVPLKSPVELTA